MNQLSGQLSDKKNIGGFVWSRIKSNVMKQGFITDQLSVSHHKIKRIFVGVLTRS